MVKPRTYGKTYADYDIEVSEGIIKLLDKKGKVFDVLYINELVDCYVREFANNIVNEDVAKSLNTPDDVEFEEEEED